jgi:LuxR family transcriptional regulator, quorum-sensing system regulator SolR
MCVLTVPSALDRPYDRIHAHRHRRRWNLEGIAMARRLSTGVDEFFGPWSPRWTAAIAAAAHSTDPEPLLRPVLCELGFDGLTYIVLAPTCAGGYRARYLWSTTPPSWASRYRECGYACVDPRVTMTARRLSPVIWDAADAESDRSVRRFLGDAARYGVRSGFALSLHDASNARVVVALDSGMSPVSESRRASVADMLGNLMLFAVALHERVLRPRCNALGEVAPANAHGLTYRERQCLRMAANGLTSGDIGGKLGIAERSVNFHMSNVLRKMEALNRPEAIAKALARGVLQAGAIA